MVVIIIFALSSSICFRRILVEVLLLAAPFSNLSYSFIVLIVKVFSVYDEQYFINKVQFMGKLCSFKSWLKSCRFRWYARCNRPLLFCRFFEIGRNNNAV